MSATSMNIRMDSEVKEQAERLFAQFGLNLTTAVNMFLRQAVREQAIPFALKLETPDTGTIDSKAAVIVSTDEWNSIQETLYLHAIPGMVDSIKAAAAEPLEYGVPVTEADFGV